MFSFEIFVVFVFNDMTVLAEQEDLLPPSTNPSYAEDREDLLLSGVRAAKCEK